MAFEKMPGPNMVLRVREPRRLVAIVGMTLLAVAVLSGRSSASDPQPELARLKRHVETLASREFGGRSGEVAEKSRRYLIEAFNELRLEPLFDRSFYQDIPGREPGQLIGRNVGAKIVGSDPKLRDEWVIVAAHFDHLGTREGVVYPGADDNASSVAMMLEVARCLARSAEPPRRSVMLIGFDLEERGLFGSRYFVEHAPVPLDRIAFFLTADMIGRSLGGVCPRHVFVMGTERFAAGRDWVKRAADGRTLRVGLLGADLLLLDRSDYGPFRARQIPFLFFSTGENPCYHTPRDVPETLDYAKVEAISRTIYGVVRDAITVERRPVWLTTPDNGMDEARSLREVFTLLREHRETLQIGKTPAYLMDRALAMLEGIEARGKIEPNERANLFRMAQVVMASVF
jgi:Peptidase family M28